MGEITIAIDGYSSCGKSTVAKELAKKLGYVYIDSGAMYRAVTLYCMQNNIIHNGKFNEQEVVNAMEAIQLKFILNSSSHVSEMHLNGVNVEKEIRGMDVSSFVSPISAIKGVREKIVGLQREFGNGRGIVMDGRDIGTNVFPGAELKIFMTADENIRAQRRWKELNEKGISTSLEEVKKNIAHRDYEDTHRQHNPLRKADDAVVLDNTTMTVGEQLQFALQLAKTRIEN
ncbi:MAG: (d)CMP kinase [Bacteroidetes bacterium]|nr:(d)CMP kinase [Bacteroidota bacterium]